jgi:Fic family protein
VILRSPAQYGRAFLHVETDGNDLTYFLLYHSRITQTAISRLQDDLEEKAEETNRLQSELRESGYVWHFSPAPDLAAKLREPLP